MQLSKIFIADDSSIQLILLEKVLKREGFAVEAFGDGSNLLKAASREMPDFIISDIDMPVLNGFDVIQEIKELPKGDTIPCFLISSKIDNAVRRKIDAIGVDGFIQKPLERKSLISGIKKLLNKSLLPS